MHFSIIHSDDTENEFNISICCPNCCSIQNGWDAAKYNKVIELSKSSIPNVPIEVNTDEKFLKFLKEL